MAVHPPIEQMGSDAFAAGIDQPAAGDPPDLPFAVEVLVVVYGALVVIASAPVRTGGAFKPARGTHGNLQVIDDKHSP